MVVAVVVIARLQVEELAKRLRQSRLILNVLASEKGRLLHHVP
jgi:hypothetical protein